MSKPYIHALSSAKKFGGKPEDYIDIHNSMDSTKSLIADNRHRAIWHTSYGCFLAEKMYGVDLGGLNELAQKHNLSPEAIADVLKWKQSCIEHGTSLQNSDGKAVQVRDIAEQHILEDFGLKFIPAASDYLNQIEMQDWMQNGLGVPPSSGKLYQRKMKVVD